VAQTKPTTHRPAASDTVWEATVELYGKTYWAVVGHSSSQDTRRQKRLEREVKASRATLEAKAREAAKQTSFCHAEAAAAAEQLRVLASAYHRVEGEVQERPTYGPGRPSATKPRPVKALHDGLQVTIHDKPAVMARKTQEAGGCVLLSHGPREGDMAHSARDVLSAEKEPHGIEQHDGVLKAPRMVTSLFLEKPERLEALGMVLLLALLIWRLMERSRRQEVETSGTTLAGWDHKPTDRPTAFMMMTKFARVMGLKIGATRQLTRPLAGPQQQYRTALGGSSVDFTLPSAEKRRGGPRPVRHVSRNASCRGGSTMTSA
jgi:transposase